MSNETKQAGIEARVEPGSAAQRPGNEMAGPPVLLTARAAAKVKETLAAERYTGHTLRIQLVEGGCAGFSYDLDLVPEARPQDLLFTVEGVPLAIDSASIASLSGTEIDYVVQGLDAGFTFKNPNARKTCGCGSSFRT